MTHCASCTQPLVLDLDSSSIPDDVTLLCACHFHWQCLVDGYTGQGRCPSCNTDITNSNPSNASSSTSHARNEPHILVTLHNEGGLQTNLDIQPLLREEGYLKAHPAEQRARAFLEFVREGDHDAVVQVLRDAAGLDGLNAADDAMDEDDGGDGDEDEEEDGEDDDVEQLPLSALLRYQDPLDGQRSALHIAVMAGNSIVVWVLLLLASRVSPDAFPENVKQIAMQMGFVREDQDGLPDIRSLQDAAGRTAWDLISGGQVERQMLGFDVGLLMPP